MLSRSDKRPSHIYVLHVHVLGLKSRVRHFPKSTLQRSSLKLLRAAVIDIGLEYLLSTLSSRIQIRRSVVLRKIKQEYLGRRKELPDVVKAQNQLVSSRCQQHRHKTTLTPDYTPLHSATS